MSAAMALSLGLSASDALAYSLTADGLGDTPHEAQKIAREKLTSAAIAQCKKTGKHVTPGGDFSEKDLGCHHGLSNKICEYKVSVTYNCK